MRLFRSGILPKTPRRLLVARSFCTKEDFSNHTFIRGQVPNSMPVKAAGLLCFTNHNEQVHFLLTCESRRKVEHPVWSIPGGKREPREMPQDVALREFKEGLPHLYVQAHNLETGNFLQLHPISVSELEASQQVYFPAAKYLLYLKPIPFIHNVSSQYVAEDPRHVDLDYVPSSILNTGDGSFRNRRLFAFAKGLLVALSWGPNGPIS